MLRRAGLPLALSVLALAGATLAEAQSRSPEPAPVPAASGGFDLFPMVAEEHRMRSYSCGGFIQGKLDTFFAGKQRLASGDYVIYELRGRVTESAAPRTIAREWLHADEHGILCGKREEGTVETVLEPPQRFLDFPLEAGKRWTWKGTASGLPCESSSVVVGPEKLALPFRNFDDA